jgi:hypothetical protein
MGISKMSKLYITMIIFIIGIITTGCDKSPQQKCIDSKSHLWDSTPNPPHKNKTYWIAVEKCKKRFPEK